ncbi:methionine synthase [Prauserella cavernicola]|uniref:Methionine synthase n=1 Tax=Prauserella cavernicola TaxID=2800127 RepID=A0A934V359_9PSEU|nr:methionine synthase [Prauserella cavernicola]MBK1786896.1 methionine synthase [Prauserella cavernicola]
MSGVTEQVWPHGVGTGIGSMPGSDPAEAATIILGELPEFPHLPELPGRGLGADVVGRSAALLVDLAVEVVPSGYRVTARQGAHHRRARDLLRWDVDAFADAADQAGARPSVVKTQVAGPWTLAAGIELARGHRVLTDHGATRDFAESLLEGLAGHVSELSQRTGAGVVVQLDEPSLPTVLAGAIPTPSGYGTVPAVAAPEARELLATVVAGAEKLTGNPVVVHCCAPRPPVALLRSTGAGALALDGTLFDGAPGSLLDELGEAWDAGTELVLGLVPAEAPPAPPSLLDVAGPALRLVDRLGFNRSILAERAVPTPTCGLAGATGEWVRRALSLTRDLGKAFLEPPQGW